MIINVRGTHGSGKTELVRRVMQHYKVCVPIYIEGRKTPIGYVCRDRRAPHLSKHVVFVAGSYDGAVSGGCDTISKVDLMYKMIRRYAKLGYDVLFEGILAQHSTPNIVRLMKRDDVCVVMIKVPIKKAIRGVEARRKARGDARPLNPDNLIKEARYTELAARRLRDQGAKVFFCKTRKRALQRTLTLLDLA
jgi:hypothetical protein